MTRSDRVHQNANVSDRPGGDIGFSTKPTFDTKAYPHPWDDLIGQMRGALSHAPGAARGAKPAPLAGKRDQLFMGAVSAAQTHKAVGQDAAFEKGLELLFDKLRQARTGLRFDLGEEGLELFLDHLIHSRFLRAPPLVVKGNGVASRRRLKRLAL